MVVITVLGGDAADSYFARYEFSRGILQKRRVWSAEFPQQAWEESSYKFNEH